MYFVFIDVMYMSNTVYIWLKTHLQSQPNPFCTGYIHTDRWSAFTGHFQHFIYIMTTQTSENKATIHLIGPQYAI